MNDSKIKITLLLIALGLLSSATALALTYHEDPANGTCYLILPSEYFCLEEGGDDFIFSSSRCYLPCPPETSITSSTTSTSTPTSTSSIMEPTSTSTSSSTTTSTTTTTTSSTTTTSTTTLIESMGDEIQLFDESTPQLRPPIDDKDVKYKVITASNETFGLMPTVVKSDEGCLIGDVIKGKDKDEFTLICDKELNNIIKEKPETTTITFGEQSKTVLITLNTKFNKSMKFEIGENSTQIDVIDQTAGGYAYCFNAPTCTSYYFYPSTADNVGYANANVRWVQGFNIFNVSELDGQTLSYAGADLSTYPTNTGAPEDKSEFYIGFCDCPECDGEGCIEPATYAECGSFASMPDTPSFDATSWDWSGWDWHTGYLDVTDALQTAIDAKTADCVAMVFRYNETLLSQNEYSRQVTGSTTTSARRPTIQYDLGGADCWDGLIDAGDWTHDDGTECVITEDLTDAGGDVFVTGTSELVIDAGVELLLASTSKARVRTDGSQLRIREGGKLRINTV